MLFSCRFCLLDRGSAYTVLNFIAMYYIIMYIIMYIAFVAVTAKNKIRHNN
jgi:hypothetical protein